MMVIVIVMITIMMIIIIIIIIIIHLHSALQILCSMHFASTVSQCLCLSLSLSLCQSRSHCLYLCVCRYGACAKIRDIEGFIALHHAVRSNHPQAVETLLAHTEALTVRQQQIKADEQLALFYSHSIRQSSFTSIYLFIYLYFPISVYLFY